MKKIDTIIKVLLAIVFISVISCNKDDNSDEINTPKGDSVLSISGYLIDDSLRPIKQIRISLDENDIFTDESGYFKFDSLDKGAHVLTLNRDLANPAFGSHTDTIELKLYSVVYDSLILPEPLVLNEPIDLQPCSITLTWTNNNPNHSEFLEYRLYIARGFYGPILNQDNGELAYIGTSIDDTIFHMDQDTYPGGPITPTAEYFFRVYAYNNHEIVSASNILRVVTPPVDTANLPLHYLLQPVTSFAGADPIKGIDWDNNGNLWIFYYNEYGYVNGVFQAEGRLVNYDYHTGQCLDTIEVTGYTNTPSGIAFDEDKVWVQMKFNGGKMDAYSTATGEKVKTYMLSSNFDPLTDIAKTDNGFILLWNHHEYEIINELGGIVRHGNTPNHVYGIDMYDKGIAYRAGYYWLMGSETGRISIMDEYGVLLGIVNTGLPFIVNWSTDCRIAIRDNKLVAATLSSIYIYDIIEP